MTRLGWSIRSAVDSDIERLAAILDYHHDTSWDRQSLADELNVAWSNVEMLTDESKEILGFLVYWHVADELQLLYVATHPDHLREGVGRHLMLYLGTRARAFGAMRITLEVRSDNQAARSLYLSVGFLEVGVRRGYYQSDGEDAHIMEWVVS